MGETPVTERCNMFDDTSPRDHGDDDERFDELILSADDLLDKAGEELLGEMETQIIGDICNDEFMTPEEVVDYVRGDRANRATMGIPSSAI